MSNPNPRAPPVEVSASPVGALAAPRPVKPPFLLVLAMACFWSSHLQNGFHLSNEPSWPSRGVMPVKPALLEMTYSLPLFYGSTQPFVLFR